MTDRTDRDVDEFAVSAWARLRWSAYLLCGDHQLAEDLRTARARTYARWRQARRDDALAYTRKVLVDLNLDRERRKRPLETGDLMPERATTIAPRDRRRPRRDRAATGDPDRPGAPGCRRRHYFDLRGRRARAGAGHRHEHVVTGAGQAARLDRRPTPPKLSPLAKWALAEIPGARRMSAYQVVLPDPGVPTEMDAEGFAVDQGPLALTCLAREGDD